jgi:hypothetical protein
MRDALLPVLALLLALSGSAFAEVAECPNWQAGDEWAWGGSYDLKETLSSLLQQLETSGVIGNWKCGGKLEGYSVMRVEAIEGEHYRTSLKSGVELRDFKISATAQEASAEISGYGVAKADGTLYYTVQELAFENAEITITGNFSFSMKGPGLEMKFKARDFQLNLSLTTDKPTDFFCFPIEVGENWSFRGSEHASYSLHGWVEGEVKMLNYENSFSQEIREGDTTDMVVEGWCECTRLVEIEVDGGRDRCFEIKIHAGSSEIFPLTLTGYYSPAKKNWVAFTLDAADLLSTLGSALGSAGEEVPAQLSGSFGELEEALQSVHGGSTLPVSSLSPREALTRIESMGEGIQIPWVLVGVPIIAIVCALLVKKFR